MPRPTLSPPTSYILQIYIELDGNKMLDSVAPLAVKRGEGDKIALEIQMAMEEAQALQHNLAEGQHMQR